MEIIKAEQGKSANEIIKELLATQGVSQRKFAKEMGCTAQNFNQRLNSGSFRVDEFMDIVKRLGYEVKVVESSTGKEFSLRRKGKGRRVKRTVAGVTYDTDKADALCSTFYADGVNEYRDGTALELYRDSEGEFFVVVYAEWNPKEDRLSVLDIDEAEKLYDEYGETAEKYSWFGGTGTTD